MGKISNQIKTVLLLGALTGLMLWIGELIGGASGLTAAFVIVLAMNFIMYWFSDKIVLAMYRAKEVKQGKLYDMVKDVARKASLPMPKVYTIPTRNPNAFATGRSPKNAAVAATDGILELLSERELKAVFAHELGHVANRDTLITTIAATIAGVIAYVASMMRYAAFFGNDDRDRGNIFELLALTIITPLVATIIQLAISRQREYLADETGARTVKDPVALADALLKIDAGVKASPMHMGNEATSSLFIENPFRTHALLNLFSTHPPIPERVARLRKMKV